MWQKTAQVRIPAAVARQRLLSLFLGVVCCGFFPAPNLDLGARPLSSASDMLSSSSSRLFCMHFGCVSASIGPASTRAEKSGWQVHVLCITMMGHLCHAQQQQQKCFQTKAEGPSPRFVRSKGGSLSVELPCRASRRTQSFAEESTGPWRC